MADTNAPNLGDAGRYLDKAKDYAKEHPDQARKAVERVEDLIDQRTGGRFKDLVDKGGDLVEGQLGVPQQTPDPTPDPSPSAGPDLGACARSGACAHAHPVAGPDVRPVARPDRPAGPGGSGGSS